MSYYRPHAALRSRLAAGAWLFTSGVAVSFIAGCDRYASGKASTAPAAAKTRDDSPPPGEAGHEHGHADEVRLTADAIERYGVRVEQALLYKLKPTFLVPGRVAFNAEAMAHVGSPLPGRVVELRARLGDTVGKGDALLVIESPELGAAQSDFLQKRIIAEAAVAAVDLSRNARDRAAGLYEQNQGISLDDLQKREVEFKSAQVGLRTSQSAALAAENRLHLLGMDQAAVEKLAETGEVNPRFTIVAPLPGRVVEREVTLGELVNPEREALLVIADTTTLWVLASVPEARLAETAVGAGASLKAGTNAHTHEGVVSYISPMVDPRTRSAEARIAVQCEHGTLWPGMFVQVEVTATDRTHRDPPPVIAVPEDAIQTVEGLPAVFVPVPNEANTFARRTVRIGTPVAGLVPIYSGLVEGESFVVAGAFILKAELGKAAAEHAH